MKKLDPHDEQGDGSQAPDRRYAHPLVGCLAVWLAVLCGVGAVAAACFGRWWLAGGAFAVASVLWLLKGEPDPRGMAEFSKLYGFDRGGDGDASKGPKA